MRMCPTASCGSRLLVAANHFHFNVHDGYAKARPSKVEPFPLCVLDCQRQSIQISSPYPQNPRVGTNR